jgi:hypothetical protein
MSEYNLTDAEKAEVNAAADAIVAERKAKIAEAARAVAAAETADVATDSTAASTIGEIYVRSNKAGTRDRVSAPFETRATTLGNLVINPTLTNVAIPSFPAPLASLVNTQTVSTNDVVIVKEHVTFNTVSTPEGTLKNEVVVTYDSVPTALEVKNGYVKASRQALADSTLLAGTIDRSLTQNTIRAIEGDIVSAITSNTDIQTVTGSDLVSAIRLAQAAVEASLYTVSAFVLNPADAAAIDLSILNRTLTGPVLHGELFGVPVVKSPLVPAGTAFVADFANAVDLFKRGAVEVYTTDADGDDFRKNIVTVLAEVRIKSAVVRPAAIRKAHVA